MKKLNVLLLGFALICGNSYAQNVQEIFNSVSNYPNESQIIAQLKSNKPFDTQLKSLNDTLNKYEKSIGNLTQQAGDLEQDQLNQLGMTKDATEESIYANMGISKADLAALEALGKDDEDSPNPAKLALAMKMAQNIQNSNFNKQAQAHSRTMANRMQGLPDNFKGGELSKSQSDEMDRRSDLTTKVAEYKMELLQKINPIMAMFENELEDFSSNYQEDEALQEKMSNLPYPDTSSLASINKYNKDTHDYACQIAAKRISKQLEIVKKAYNKLKAEQTKLTKKSCLF